MLIWFLTAVVAGTYTLFYYFAAGSHFAFNYIWYSVSYIDISANVSKAYTYVTSIVPLVAVMFTTILILDHLFKARIISQRLGGTQLLSF